MPPQTSARFAPASVAPDAIGFLLAQVRRQPGQITLLALGKLTNVGAALARDRSGFGQPTRLVVMGGSAPVTANRSTCRPGPPTVNTTSAPTSRPPRRCSSLACQLS